MNCWERIAKKCWDELFEEIAANDEKRIVWIKDKKIRSTNNSLIHRNKTINVPNMFDGDY
jgi:hypothetical protein